MGYKNLQVYIRRGEGAPHILGPQTRTRDSQPAPARATTRGNLPLCSKQEWLLFRP